MKDIETLYTEYDSKYGEETLKERGRNDGEKGVPPIQYDEFSPFESELLYSVKMLASKVAGDYKADLERIDAQIKGESVKVDADFQDDLARIEDQYNANKKIHSEKHSLKQSRQNFEQDKRRFDVMYNKLNRMPIEYFPHWAYLLFAIAIFLGEVPLNAMVFQIFGENQIMTWIMALVIGLSIPLSAHFIGIKVREHEPKFSIPNAIKGASVFALIVGALYGISLMREDYLRTFQEELGLTETLVETSSHFFWLNVAVFVVAILLAYLSHDSVPGYQSAHAKYLKSKKALEKEEQKLAEALKWVENARVGELDQARKRKQERLKGVTELMGEYDRLLKEGQEQEGRCVHRLGRDLSMYRHANVTARENGGIPQSFNKEATFELELIQFKEKLRNEDHP